jgi:hypothetical protein
MSTCRRWSWRLLMLFFAAMSLGTSAEAYYGRRYSRGGRGYNGMAALQRANAAMNAAQARVYAAEANLARQVRAARQEAEHSPKLAAAKSERAQSERDYQAARQAVVEDLKKSDPEFQALLQECQSLRNRLASARKGGSSSGTLASLQNQLKAKTRKALLIENDAIDASGSVKDAQLRLASAHEAENEVKNELKAAIAKNPNVQAAQKQLAQANQQAMIAANRVSNTSWGGYSGGNRYRRGYGYGRGYRHAGGYRLVGGAGRVPRVQTARYAQHRRR